ncbi:hypothetical protein, partial [Cellulomonas triticagri]
PDAGPAGESPAGTVLAGTVPAGVVPTPAPVGADDVPVRPLPPVAPDLVPDEDPRHGPCRS